MVDHPLLCAQCEHACTQCGHHSVFKPTGHPDDPGTCANPACPTNDPDHQFRFEMWATHRPDDPYYVTNWDRRKKITVVAANKKAAINAAASALGPVAAGRHWVFNVISITDHRIPTEAGHG